jgi:hypothetical protein
MRKTITALALLFSTTTTFAQQEIINLAKELRCSEAEYVIKYFTEEYQEKPVWVGKSNTGTYLTLLVNKEKRSWTLIEYSSRLACVLGAGEATSSSELSL